MTDLPSAVTSGMELSTNPDTTQGGTEEEQTDLVDTVAGGSEVSVDIDTPTEKKENEDALSDAGNAGPTTMPTKTKSPVEDVMEEKNDTPIAAAGETEQSVSMDSVTEEKDEDFVSAAVTASTAEIELSIGTEAYKRMSKAMTPNSTHSYFASIFPAIPLYLSQYILYVLSYIRLYWDLVKTKILFEKNGLSITDSRMLRSRSVDGVPTEWDLERYQIESFYWTAPYSFEFGSIVLFYFVYLFNQNHNRFFSYHLFGSSLNQTINSWLFGLCDLSILLLSWILRNAYSFLMGYRIIDSVIKLRLHIILFWLKEVFDVLAVCVVIQACSFITTIDDFLSLQNIILFYQLMCCLPNWVHCINLFPVVLEFLPFVKVYDRSYLRLAMCKDAARRSWFLYMAGMNLGSVSMTCLLNLEIMYHIGLCFNIAFGPSITKNQLERIISRSRNEHGDTMIKNIVHFAILDLLMYIIYIVNDTDAVPVICGYKLNEQFVIYLVKECAVSDEAEPKSSIDLKKLISRLTFQDNSGSETENLLNLIHYAISRIDESGVMIPSNQENSESDFSNDAEHFLKRLFTEGFDASSNEKQVGRLIEVMKKPLSLVSKLEKKPEQEITQLISRDNNKEEKIVGYFLIALLFYLRSVMDPENEIDYYWTEYPFGNSSLLVDYFTKKVVPYPDYEVDTVNAVNAVDLDFQRRVAQQWILNRYFCASSFFIEKLFPTFQVE